MTVEKKISIKELENSFEMSQCSCGAVLYDESDNTVTVDCFTPSQVKVFDYLSTFLEVNDELFSILANCCQSIAEGGGKYLSKDVESAPCLARLVRDLELIYESRGSEDGSLKTQMEFGQIHNVKALLDNRKIISLVRKVKAEKIMSAHSFAETGLMSLLSFVRKNSVVRCVDFKDIKQEDRTLWYALLSVGRRVIALEAYMLVRIWKMELSNGRPILAKCF
jgi:hypothetical protein